MYNPRSSNLHLIELRTEAEARAGVPMRILSGFPEPLPASGSMQTVGGEMHSSNDFRDIVGRAMPYAVATLLLLLLLMTSGCASLTEGLDQHLTVLTDPPSAVCHGTREGSPIFSVMSGDTVIVSKSRHAITLECSKPGFVTAHQLVDSSVSLMGLASPGLDYMTGALNKYPDSVTVWLQQKSQ